MMGVRAIDVQNLYRLHNLNLQRPTSAEEMGIWTFDSWRSSSHSPSEYDWTLFQFAIARTSLYVLGAGASLPIISRDLTSEIERGIRSMGSIPAVPDDPSELKQWMLPYDLRHEIDALRTDSISQNVFNRHAPNALVEMLLARRLTAPGLVRTAQYLVFDRFAPSVLLNFNNDNLAEVVHRKHLRLRPHGAIDAEFVHASIVDEAIWYLGTVPESWIEQLTYHRPLPEPIDITNRQEYRLLPRCWETLHAVVVIGYSFGEQRQSGLIHDSESFDQIVDLLRWRPKAVLVIGPEPGAVASRLETGIRRRVSTLACKWNVLAQFICDGAFERARTCSGRRDTRTITSRYQAYEERVELLEAVRRAEEAD
jgi:hypothetical protein